MFLIKKADAEEYWSIPTNRWVDKEDASQWQSKYAAKKDAQNLIIHYPELEEKLVITPV